MIVLAFLGVFLLDMAASYAWAKSISDISDKKPLPATLWSTALYLAGAINVIVYNKDNWYLIPAVIGSAIGVYFGVKSKNKKNDSKDSL